MAVTGGGKDCFWFDRESGRVRHVPAFKVNVVDTLAAGDVFHGAFALGLAEGQAMDEIISFSNCPQH
ncbi:MAG: PfkB family carbohydrate kinase [Phyllobacterium sp.]